MVLLIRLERSQFDKYFDNFPICPLFPGIHCALTLNILKSRGTGLQWHRNIWDPLVRVLNTFFFWVTLSRNESICGTPCPSKKKNFLYHNHWCSKISFNSSNPWHQIWTFQDLWKTTVILSYTYCVIMALVSVSPALDIPQPNTNFLKMKEVLFIITISYYTSLILNLRFVLILILHDSKISSYLSYQEYTLVSAGIEHIYTPKYITCNK